MKKETINSLIKALIVLFNNANEDIIFEAKWADNTAFAKLKKASSFVCTTLQVSYDDGVRTNRLTVNEESMMSMGGDYKGSYKVTVPIVDGLEIIDDQAETLLVAIERLESAYERKLEKEAAEEQDRIVLEFIERIND